MYTFTWTEISDHCARLMAILFGISLAITYTEKLTLSEDYGHQGWMTWKIFSFERSPVRIFRTYPELFERLFGRTGLITTLTLALCGVVLIIATPLRSLLFTVGATLVLWSCLWVHGRSNYGGDGSQQVNLLIAASLWIGFGKWGTPLLGAISLLFIAAQACLSYFTSGVAKLVSPLWMSGNALGPILSTASYGSPAGYRLAIWKPKFTASVCITTVFIETLFPVLVLCPIEIFVLFLVWGVVFHLMNAFLMGLNTFFWSFTATYPSLFFLWYLIHQKP